MKRFRDLLTWTAFAAVVAVSLAAGVESARQGLPQAEVTDPIERLRWLSERDVRDEPLDAKLRLVHRLEEDFSKSVDWQAEIDRFDDQQWERFEANFEDLMKLWFTEKVNTWAELPEDQRDLYLDEQFRYLMSWKPLERGAAPDRLQGGRRQASSFNSLNRRLRSWIDSEEPAERKKIEDFIQAVVSRFVQRLANPSPAPGSWYY